MKKQNTKEQAKDKTKIEVSEYNPVPLYRSYGVTSKEYPLLTKLKVIVQKVLLTLMFAIPLSFSVVGVIAITFASGSLLIPTVVFTSLAVFLTLKFSKPLRMRLKMVRELKKLCQNDGYRCGYKLEIKDSLFSAKWSTGRSELVFHTNTKVYHVRMYAIRKKRSRLRFESDKEITVLTLPPRKLAIIYDLKAKQKRLSVDFPEIRNMNGKENVNAIVFCPRGEEWSYKHSEKTYLPTANGEKVFGYKVYTAPGFVRDVMQAEEN